MPQPLLLDTDVLIDYLRGHAEAVRFLQQCQAPLHVSVITISELYVGVREGKERAVLDSFLAFLTVVEITPAIAKQAGLWRRDYGKSHGTGLMDALIAACCKQQGCQLVTLNKKHFPMLDQLLIPYGKTK
jgi:predicted nucleic acid-binding protein